MATQTLNSTPTALSLTADTWYTIQCRSTKNFYIQTATSAPSNDDSAFVISPYSMIQAKRGSGEQIYVWQNDVRGDRGYGFLVVEPSA
ncbi:MAG: hypothetical protein ISN29_01600 [Gammaproteobacteria bacterium AqS3]|nr:hypothetical protein [Gammaproteobacteria bacterium AqS3]